MRPLFLLVAASLLTAAAAPASDRQAEVERAIFELCPRLIDGTLSLADPAGLATIGYTAAAPRVTPAGTNAQATRGSGAELIALSGSIGADSRICSVWFGGPDNAALFKKARKRAKAEGFDGGSPLRLGDGTPLYSFRRADDPSRSLVFIAGNAGGSFALDPATTAILMVTGKGD